MTPHKPPMTTLTVADFGIAGITETGDGRLEPAHIARVLRTYADMIDPSRPRKWVYFVSYERGRFSSPMYPRHAVVILDREIVSKLDVDGALIDAINAQEEWKERDDRVVIRCFQLLRTVLADDHDALVGSR